MRKALVTNALHYGGPAAVAALLAEGFEVIAQDASFSDEQAATAYTRELPGTVTLGLTNPEAVAHAVWQQHAPVQLVVCNDAWPAIHGAFESLSPQDLHRTLEALVVFPFVLLQHALPYLKQQAKSNILFITSARTELPLAGGSIPDMARAAANALVVSLSVELAPLGIPVNAIAPNYYYSEAYFPAALYKHNDTGKAFIQQVVPAGRLGEPEELGELIKYFAHMSGTFHTGSIVKFTGGWPMAPQRPF